jgi:hypothetical protein
MPFVFVETLPSTVSKAESEKLQKDIREALAATVGVDVAWITPIAHTNAFGDPKPGVDTIYVKIDSAMFVGPERGTAEFREKANFVVGQLVFQALGKSYEVECLIGDLNPSGKVIFTPE